MSSLSPDSTMNTEPPEKRMRMDGSSPFHSDDEFTGEVEINGEESEKADSTTEKGEENVDDRDDEKVDKDDAKVDQKDDAKGDQKDDAKVDQKDDAKVDQKDDAKVDQKDDPKVDQDNIGENDGNRNNKDKEPSSPLNEETLKGEENAEDRDRAKVDQKDDAKVDRDNIGENDGNRNNKDKEPSSPLNEETVKDEKTNSSRTESAINDSVDEIFDDSYTRSSDEMSDEEESEGNKKEIPLEAFNMDEEKDLGTFDKDGNFLWKRKTREPMDAWLAHDGAKPIPKKIVFRKAPPAQLVKRVELRANLKEITQHMIENETVQEAIHRMSNPVASSASARLALKKAGGSYSAAKSSEKLQHFLNLVTQLPVTCHIYELKKNEVVEILESKEKFEKFNKKAFPPKVEVINISSSSSDDSDDEKKKPSSVTISSSDDDDDDEEEDDKKSGGGKPKSNGQGGRNVECIIEDMFKD